MVRDNNQNINCVPSNDITESIGYWIRVGLTNISNSAYEKIILCLEVLLSIYLSILMNQIIYILVLVDGSGWL
jgi:hypothetical protein